jgi:ankyrin repeat protein
MSCLSVDLVKRAKADVNRRMKQDGDTPLMVAIKFARGSSPHIPILLASKDIDLEVRNKAGHTVLMVAAGMGRHDVVSQLLQAGADPSAVVKSRRSKKDQAESGGTVLHVAVEQGNSGAVEQLIAAGADVHALGADGATLLVRHASASTCFCLDRLNLVPQAQSVRACVRMCAWPHSTLLQSQAGEGRTRSSCCSSTVWMWTHGYSPLELPRS